MNPVPQFLYQQDAEGKSPIIYPPPLTNHDQLLMSPTSCRDKIALFTLASHEQDQEAEIQALQRTLSFRSAPVKSTMPQKTHLSDQSRREGKGKGILSEGEEHKI